MIRKTLTFLIACLVLLVTIPELKAYDFEQERPQSYAEANLSTSSPTVIQPTGASTLGDLSIASTNGAVFRNEYNTWALSATNGSGITLSFNVALPGKIQVAMYVAAAQVNGSPNNPYRVMVSNSFGTNQLSATAIDDTVPNFHWNVIDIPQHLVAAGENKVTVYLDTDASTQLFVQNVKLLPQKVRAQYGVLNTTLYTQFGESSVNGPVSNGGQMWTRAYGLDSLIEMLPGPTFYFDPGDLLNVNMVNKLNKENNALLKEYEKLNSAPAFYEDEALVGDAVRGEINIPHNIDNTNLHVHGLHVDPSKDDVTIVIVPEGADSTGYDAPVHAHAPVDNDFTILNEFSVSDQSVKGGSWDYQYKIPYIHLPGTHWYHPHKHGSTSAQVENGLAGTIVIQENENNAIVPYPNTTGTTSGGGNQSNYDLEDWRSYHDRVLAIQEITNFGLQLGKGNGQGAISTGSIQTTVNGEVLPTIRFAPGQLERWRLVNAGTNHRAFSQIWLGEYIATKDTTYSYTHTVQSGGKSKKVTNDTTVTYKVYKSVPIHMAAVDGITLSELRKVTAEKPALMAPGNRTDFLVSLDEGNYTLFKDYDPKEPIMVIATYSDSVLYTNYPAKHGFWNESAPGKSNPYLFAKVVSDSTGFNFGSFKQSWNGSSQSMIPLIKTKPTADGNFLDVNFTTKSTFKENTVGLWQPLGFQGQLVEAELFHVHVTGAALSGDQTPKMPGKNHLQRIAPTKSGNAPSYVSPISDSDILQSRPVIFDVSGVRIELNNVHNDKMNQFTLNGRYFVLNDPIGNPHADERLRKLVTQPQKLESPTDIKNKSIAQSMEFVDQNPTAFTNKVTAADGTEGYYFMNPSYYQGITKNAQGFYTFDGQNEPTWEALTGIPNDTITTATGAKKVKTHPSVVNKNSMHYEANKALVDSLPLAQTAEEWYLINNSDVSHPFHIHINPFFVVEVGQLSYEKYGGSKKKPKYDWFMKAVTAEGSQYTQRPEMPTDGSATPGTIYKGEIGVEAIVGNWWDTITIPAHGYVKVRYWFNVPYQTGEGMDAKVIDNYNRTGIWVYHCHILRHEDRGMMMPVISIANDNDKK